MLQLDPKHRFRAKGVPTQQAREIIYREDKRANEDWSAIIEGTPENRVVVPERASDKEALEREWLLAALDTNRFYSVRRQQEQRTEDGNVATIEVTEFFQVLQIQHARSRPHLVHTVNTADDPIFKFGISLNVVMCEPWRVPDVEPGVGSREGFPVTGSEWVAPSRIAHFNDWLSSLERWNTYRPHPVAAGCLVLSDAERAQPRWPLTDERCPVLTITAALRDKGWVAEDRLVEHRDLSLVYDGREAPRMRFYYTLLLFALQQGLRLSAGRVPPQQPSAFYRVLLKGIAAAPGQGNEFYMKLLNEKPAETRQ